MQPATCTCMSKLCRAASPWLAESPVGQPNLSKQRPYIMYIATTFGGPISAEFYQKHSLAGTWLLHLKVIAEPRFGRRFLQSTKMTKNIIVYPVKPYTVTPPPAITGTLFVKELWPHLRGGL